MKYDVIIFDLDGTLLDTLRDLSESVNYALTLHGYPARSQEEVRSFVGNGVRNLMNKALPGGFENPDFEQVFSDFKAHYAVHFRDLTCPYAGIMELMDELSLRGLRMAIVSNKNDVEVKKLNEIFFGGKFDSAIGERPDVARKPAPDSVLATLEFLGVAKERAVYVGDSEVDVLTARNAGLDCIAVTWGFRSRAELIEAGATVLIDKPMDILNLL